QEPDPVAPVAGHEVVELLVRQRLDRRGVEDARALVEGGRDGVLPDHGLAGPGGRGDEDRSPLVDRVERPLLERIEREPQVVLEACAALVGGHVRNILPTRIAASKKRYIGTERIARLIGSPLGVMTAT